MFVGEGLHLLVQVFRMSQLTCTSLADSLCDPSRKCVRRAQLHDHAANTVSHCEIWPPMCWPDNTNDCTLPIYDVWQLCLLLSTQFAISAKNSPLVELENAVTHPTLSKLRRECRL